MLNRLKKGLAFLMATGLWLASPAVFAARADRTPPPEGYETAVENTAAALFYKPSAAAIAVLDKTSGRLWQSALPPEQVPGGELTDYLRSEFSSLLTVGYVLVNKKDAAKVDAPLDTLDAEVSGRVSGTTLTYALRLPALHLSLELALSLEGGVLTVSLPDGAIREADGVREKLEARIQSLKEAAGAAEAIVDSILDAGDYPKNLRSLLKSGQKSLDALYGLIEKIGDAAGLEKVSDDLLAAVNELLSVLINSSSKKGFFASVLDPGSSVSDETRQRYTALQGELDDLLERAKITATGLKAINVAHVVDAQLLSYFGACGDHADGYMLYPNGSGTVNEFKENHGVYNSEYRTYAFSDDQPDIDWEKTIDGAGLKRLPVPYFGVRQADSAFIAYVDSGQSDSYIRFAPSGYIVNVSRVHAGFTYRRPVAVAATGGQWQSGQIPTAYEPERAALDAAVRYEFLSGPDADYSGMARALRAHLLESGALKSTAAASAAVPLALDFFGGYSERMLLFENYRIGTTFEQARQILEQIAGGASLPFLINYRGFQTGGYGVYPAKNAVAGQLGGLSGLRALAEFAAAGGSRLFLEANPLEVQVGRGGYAEGDLALNAFYQLIESQDKTTYILSPSVAGRKMDDTWAFFRSAGVSGAMLRYAGSFVYYDYAAKHAHRRGDTVAAWKSLLERGKEELGHVAAEGGNVYTWAEADWIRGAPSGASGYVHTDYAVPFFQLLLHGSIPYTGQPVNQFYDKDLQFLQMVEYGSLPYFALSAGELDYEQAGSFLSPFPVVYGDIVDTYNRYAAMAGTLDKAMRSHENKDGVATVTYEGGQTVVINYTDAPVIRDGRAIGPLDYAVIGGKEGASLEKTQDGVGGPGEQSRLSLYNPLGHWIWPVLLVSVVLLAGAGIFQHKRRSHV